MSLNRYRLGEILCVQWNPELAAWFPNANHTGCRQEGWADENGMWRPYSPPRCVGWHCPKCGKPTGGLGHHDCPDRPEGNN